MSGRIDRDATAVSQPPAAAQTEPAALLLVDKDGGAKILCLPDRDQPRALWPGAKLLQVMDAIAKDGSATVAALTGPPGGTIESPGGELVLFAPGASPRKLAKGTRLARFSPGGDALLFQSTTRERVSGGAVVEDDKSYVLDLTSGAIDDLGEAVDALWEADGKHVRATRLTKNLDEHGTTTGSRRTSIRIRWDRESKTAAGVGPGSAQIPAPHGAAVAWSADQRNSLPPSHCAVQLGPGGWHQHPIVGPFCMGIADDRGVRWSPDGQWLAFARPGPKRGEGKPESFFVDVVGILGGRHPAMSALLKQVDPDEVAIAAGPGTPWMDWSPSQRFLALQDGAGDLRIYDLENRRISFLGKGERPTWSPGGGYLLVLSFVQSPAASGASARNRTDGSAAEAFVLPGGSRAASLALGQVRDICWLPAAACAKD